jgi:hypothetical protein
VNPIKEMNVSDSSQSVSDYIGYVLRGRYNCPPIMVEGDENSKGEQPLVEFLFIK